MIVNLGLENYIYIYIYVQEVLGLDFGGQPILSVFS